MRLFILAVLVFFILPLTTASCQEKQLVSSAEILSIRDSLDAIRYEIPQIPEMVLWQEIVINTQAEWDALGETLSTELKNGVNNIEVRVRAKNLMMPVKPHSILSLNYPKANIKVISDGASFVPEGFEFTKSSRDKEYKDFCGNRFWVVSYSDFNMDDIIIDESGNEIPLREDVKEQKEEIVKDEDGVWRMRTDLPNLTEEECKDFYLLITRDWTSARHKVLYVKSGWLYFNLDSDELHSDRNPNLDRIQYGISPRYRLINCPVSQGLHITNGKIYVPWKYNKIRICKGGFLLHMGGCRFNSFELTGFKLSGLGRCPIGVYHSVFTTGMFVHHNTFRNLSNLAISAVWNENVVFSDNTVTNTRVGVAECGGKNNTIARNRLKNIGWMLNTRAIIGSGDGLHICDNVIEDFNYAAIAVGSRAATRDSVILNYIVEKNLIRLSKAYTDNYLSNTLSDGGAIYTGPSCTQGIIRNNVIENIKGINGNRGVFLDDGAKNLAIYGNLIINTTNCYDIDLRLCYAFAKDIPDHNTKNYMFQNIMTGGYRFEDSGASSYCVGGQNILLGTGAFQKTKLDLSRQADDIIVEGCSYKNRKVVIPKRYAEILDGVRVDSFVRRHLVVH